MDGIIFLGGVLARELQNDFGTTGMTRDKVCYLNGQVNQLA